MHECIQSFAALGCNCKPWLLPAGSSQCQAGRLHCRPWTPSQVHPRRREHSPHMALVACPPKNPLGHESLGFFLPLDLVCPSWQAWAADNQASSALRISPSNNAWSASFKTAYAPSAGVWQGYACLATVHCWRISTLVIIQRPVSFRLRSAQGMAA